jgi:hypothetical protein
MADIRTLKLALLADTKDFIKGLDKADNETRSFSDKLGTALKAGAVAFAALGAAAGAMAIKIGKDAIGAASDFSEEISKARVIFGDASKDIEQFAETAADSLGQSKKQAVSAASTFATLGKAAGLTGKDLSKFSIGFVKLASDLASFNNTSPEDAIQAIGAALRGEAEPIRRYGILLNDATLKNEALALGLIKSTKEALSPANKVLAAQAAIYKQTSDAQGDFARTSDGLANSQRQLAANIEDVKIQLGEVLLPIVLQVSDVIKKTFVPALENLIDGLTRKGKQGLTRAFYDAGTGVVSFGYDMTGVEGSAYKLGESIRDLTTTIEKLLTIDPNSTDSLFVKTLDTLDRIITKIDNATASYTRFKESFLGGAFLDVANLANPAVLAGRFATGGAGNLIKAPNTTNYFNIKNAVDPQAVARSIVKVQTTATKTTGIKPFIPGR